MENEFDILDGVLLSPSDERDFKLHMFAHGDVGKQYDTTIKNFRQPRPFMIHSQGSTYKCVAYCIKSIIEYFNRLQYGKYVPISVDYIYSNREPDDANYKLKNAMYIRDALKATQKNGACEENLLPPKLFLDIAGNPDINEFWNTALLTEARRKNAENYKIGTYMSLDRIEDIKLSLMKNYGVCLIIPATELLVGGYNVVIDGNNLYYNGKSPVAHAVMCVGWEEHQGRDYLICVNTKGDRWGDRGEFRIPFETMIYEKWAVADEILMHWSNQIYDYLDGINVNFPERNVDKKATRAEAFKMLALTLGSKELDESNDYYYNYCNNNGIKILENRYDSTITRGETMVLFAKFLGWKESDSTNVPKNSHWAETFFVYLNKNGIPLTDKRYNDTIKVAEFATFCAKKLGFKG